MLSAIRNRMTPATVIATVALIFAMTGGAYAASKVLITSTKQIKPSVLKQLTGKAGKAGPAGAPGAAGPAGPAGSATPGAKGETGAPGAKGENGAPGTSVTSAPLVKGNATCKEGGSEFTAGASKTTACNGEKGAPGPAGPITGELQKGVQETGAWFAPPTSTTFENAPISFTLELKEGLDESHVHYITLAEVEKGQLPPGCEGNAEAPLAEDGVLCIFEGENSGNVGNAESASILKLSALFVNGASRAGAYMLFVSKETGASFEGSYAIRGS